MHRVKRHYGAASGGTHTTIHRKRRFFTPTFQLPQVHWRRVILDEGHQLGASLSQTNKLLTACALRADCRWVMTGGWRYAGRTDESGGHSSRLKTRALGKAWSVSMLWK